MKNVLVCLFLIYAWQQTLSQEMTPKLMRAVIRRPDGNEIPFTLVTSSSKDGFPWTIRNADESIELKNMRRIGDSVFAELPVFESRLHFFVGRTERFEGTWFKGAPSGYNTQMVTIFPNQAQRFDGGAGNNAHQISGRWSVQFSREDKSTRQSIAEFKQDGDHLSGTFLNPSGDYRFLEGVIRGDSLFLSTFDGSHAFYFSAFIENDRQIRGGIFCAGTSRKEGWTAMKDENAKLSGDPEAPAVKDPNAPLDFRFPGLDGKMVSIRDNQFRGKPVIIQLMGSWCSNCMDETAFMSEFSKAYEPKGLAVVALAYEYSTNFERSKNSLQKFKDRFHITYPLLITGVTANDSLKTERSLPQLVKIESFPTTIFLDRSGRVVKIHTGFNGPATGVHYEEEKKYFRQVVDSLLSQ